jgi:hypothetical protein
MCINFYQVMAEDSGPTPWSEGCSGIASTSRFCSVSILHGLTNIHESYFSFIALAGMYLSLKHLSLSDATTLTFVTPILTGFSAAIFLKEHLSFRETFSGCSFFFFLKSISVRRDVVILGYSYCGRC